MGIYNRTKDDLGTFIESDANNSASRTASGAN
jgi:hypothetical protein